MKISVHEYKEYLKNEVDKLKLDKLQMGVENVKKLLNVMVKLNEIEFLIDKPLVSIKNINESEEKDYPENAYIFKKLLIGGELIGGKNIFISEAATRSYGLKSGDLIRYTGNEHDFNIEIIDKQAEEIKDNFIAYKYCEVKRDDPLLYCDESSFEGGKLVKVDDIPYKFVLPTKVIEKLKIKEGDFIDIGYEKGNHYSFRVIWKHEDVEEHITPKPSSYYKESKEKQINPLYYGIDFEGKSILVIGCEPRKRYYKEAIGECNGEFLYCSGNESLDRIYSECNKADIVLLLKDFLSHTTVKKTVEYCKGNNIIFSVVDGLGIKTIVFESRRLLNKIDEK